MKNLLFILLSVFPTCHHCEPQTFDAGPLPEKASLMVPYADGSQIKLNHSNGKTITFQVSREVRSKEETFCDDCCTTFKFEEDKTLLTPDYPIADISLNILNYDTAHYSCEILIDRGYFLVPEPDDPYHDPFLKDSIKIGGKYYNDVYCLSNQNSYMNENPVTYDSLYYNYAEGILKIVMTNSESYEITD